MHFSHLLAPAALLATATAQIKGFNYGSTNIDGTPRYQQQWVDHFNKAKNLPGASGFTSARLFTTIQAGTTNAPIEAIPAAISTDTSLLLGLWASAGAASFANEIAALQAAVSQYGTAFTDRVVGISVGSEDMYRISPTGVDNLSGPGVGPDVIANYIGQTRSAIANTALAGKPIVHVDTWTAWANSSNVAAINAVDVLGVDAYPYYETENGNDISNALNLFNSALGSVNAVAQGKPVWVTETGWPTTGETLAQAVPNVANAKTYWDAVGCGVLFGKYNTWWFTLEDPNFGVVGTSIANNPLYDLTCPASALVSPISYQSASAKPTATSTTARRTRSRSSMGTLSTRMSSQQLPTSRSLRSTRQPSTILTTTPASGASASTLRRSTWPTTQTSTTRPTRSPKPPGPVRARSLSPDTSLTKTKFKFSENCPVDLNGLFFSPTCLQALPRTDDVAESEICVPGYIYLSPLHFHDYHVHDPPFHTSKLPLPTHFPPARWSVHTQREWVYRRISPR